MTTKNIPLDQPIKRGDNTIDTVTLRKPGSGELRGLKLVDLLQMDVNAIIRVVPRISTPTLTEQEVATADPADLVAMGSAISSFLLSKSDLQELTQTE